MNARISSRRVSDSSGRSRPGGITGVLSTQRDSTRLDASRPRSTIELGGDDVQAPQHGHDVGDQVVLDDVREDLEMDERGGPRAGAPGGLAAVGDQVIAELPVGTL